MTRRQIPLEQLPLSRSKKGEGVVDRRNYNPKDIALQLKHRKGSQRVSSTEWPRESGLGGWSETETACLLGLADYSRVFEFTDSAGSVDGYTVTFEFRPGSLTYEAGTDSEVILWRWGGKNAEAYVAGIWAIEASSGAPDIFVRFRFQDSGAGKLEQIEWSPGMPSADTVWYVAMTLASGPSGGISIRTGDGRGGTISQQDVITDLISEWNADFQVESADKHSDLTLLGGRTRANVEGEDGAFKAAKGSRPVISNFKVYSAALSDSELRGVLGQEV